jgi:hypothetical protein
MRRLEALFGRVGEREVGEVFVVAMFGVLHVESAICAHASCTCLQLYQLLDGLLQLLHIYIVALPLLDILPLLGLGRSRATGESRCDHVSAISSLRLASVLVETGASRENFLVENFRPR